jgi:hypothetical protein
MSWGSAAKFMLAHPEKLPNLEDVSFDHPPVQFAADCLEGKDLKTMVVGKKGNGKRMYWIELNGEAETVVPFGNAVLIDGINDLEEKQRREAKYPPKKGTKPSEIDSSRDAVISFVQYQDKHGNSVSSQGLLNPYKAGVNGMPTYAQGRLESSAILARLQGYHSKSLEEPSDVDGTILPVIPSRVVFEQPYTTRSKFEDGLYHVSVQFKGKLAAGKKARSIVGIANMDEDNDVSFSLMPLLDGQYRVKAGTYVKGFMGVSGLTVTVEDSDPSVLSL